MIVLAVTSAVSLAAAQQNAYATSCKRIRRQPEHVACSQHPFGISAAAAGAVVVVVRVYLWRRWHDAPSQTINFITEYFTSGTLRQ
jgi:hypothetical protein